VRWDWESDGIYDSPFTPSKVASHRYSDVGSYPITLQVKDTADLTNESTHEVEVKTLVQIILDVAAALYEYDGCDLNADGEVNAADAIISMQRGR
jgi:PKD repeat protein